MAIEWKSPPHEHPGLAAHRDQRAGDLQNVIADQTTKFAGSMYFVYLHVVWFTIWIVFRSRTTLSAC